MTHLLDIADLSKDEIQQILGDAIQLKTTPTPFLTGKTIGLIFEKPSTRTRLSFEVGIHKLGGNAVYIKGDEVQIGYREPISHVSRVLSRYLDVIVYRGKDHHTIQTFAKWSSIPVINGLSNRSHPCQALADALTIQQHFGSFDDVFLTYIGDANNVCQSLMEISHILGFKMAVVCPKNYQPTTPPPGIIVTDNIDDIIHHTNVIYTDVWVSMGDENDAAKRLVDFATYQVTSDILARAHPDTIFLHCLPAQLGQEVTDEVFESPQSKVFDQAENRMHAQNAILAWIMKGR